MDGKVALVTGAGHGIGRAVALALAEQGVVVGVHHHHSASEARATLETIQAGGGRGLLLRGDLTNEVEANRVVDELLQEEEHLDIVINNAGGPLERTALADCSTELWRRVFALNVDSAFFITRRAIPHLRATGEGAIVNILSLSVQTGGAGGAGPYAAAKGALQVMTRTLARELAPAVRVNAVMPGVIETRHHEVFTTPQRMEQYRQETPLGRNGTADEVAQAVVFLASDLASFINGAIVDVNGGRFLR